MKKASINWQDANDMKKNGSKLTKPNELWREMRPEQPNRRTQRTIFAETQLSQASENSIHDLKKTANSRLMTYGS